MLLVVQSLTRVGDLVRGIVMCCGREEGEVGVRGERGGAFVREEAVISVFVLVRAVGEARGRGRFFSRIGEETGLESGEKKGKVVVL